jgi:hypothetical protein
MSASARRIVALCLFGALGGAAVAADDECNVNVFLGQKLLSDDWKDDTLGVDLQDQMEFGVLFSWQMADWPFAIAADVLASSKDQNVLGVDLEGTTRELALGIRRTWLGARARPFFGVGLGYVAGEITGSMAGFVLSVDDSTVGAWVDGGVFWRLGRHFNLGFEGRYTFAEIEPTVMGISQSVDAGGLHLGLLLGFGWDD